MGKMVAKNRDLEKVKNILQKDHHIFPKAFGVKHAN